MSASKNVKRIDEQEIAITAKDIANYKETFAVKKRKSFTLYSYV